MNCAWIVLYQRIEPNGFALFSGYCELNERNSYCLRMWINHLKTKAENTFGMKNSRTPRRLREAFCTLSLEWSRPIYTRWKFQKNRMKWNVKCRCRCDISVAVVSAASEFLSANAVHSFEYRNEKLCVRELYRRIRGMNCLLSATQFDFTHSTRVEIDRKRGRGSESGGESSSNQIQFRCFLGPFERNSVLFSGEKKTNKILWFQS